MGAVNTPAPRLTLASFELPPPRPMARLLSRFARHGVPARDAVSVFVDDRCVTLIVRDNGLTEDAAFEAAREVARRLMGHDTGLRRVTVDGRRGYRAALGDAPSARCDR